MNDQPLVRKSFKIAVVLFAATMMAGYVAYSHYKSQRPIRSTKSTAILDEMRLIDSAKDQYVIEENPPVPNRPAPNPNPSPHVAPNSPINQTKLFVEPSANPRFIDSTKSAPVFRAPPQSNPFAPASDQTLSQPEQQVVPAKPLRIAPGSKSAPVFVPSPQPKGS